MEPRIPLPECGLPVTIQDPRPDLQQQMGAALRPGHLLLLAEALADYLIDRRFHEAGANPLSGPVALPIVRNETLVALNIRVELLHGFQELSGLAMTTGGHRGGPRRSAPWLGADRPQSFSGRTSCFKPTGECSAGTGAYQLIS
jgi:hypothetical protein